MFRETDQTTDIPCQCVSMAEGDGFVAPQQDWRIVAGQDLSRDIACFDLLKRVSAVRILPGAHQVAAGQRPVDGSREGGPSRSRPPAGPERDPYGTSWGPKVGPAEPAGAPEPIEADPTLMPNGDAEDNTKTYEFVSRTQSSVTRPSSYSHDPFATPSRRTVMTSFIGASGSMSKASIAYWAIPSAYTPRAVKGALARLQSPPSGPSLRPINLTVTWPDRSMTPRKIGCVSAVAATACTTSPTARSRTNQGTLSIR